MKKSKVSKILNKKFKKVSEFYEKDWDNVNKTWIVKSKTNITGTFIVCDSETKEVQLIKRKHNKKGEVKSYKILENYSIKTCNKKSLQKLISIAKNIKKEEYAKH